MQRTESMRRTFRTLTIAVLTAAAPRLVPAQQATLPATPAAPPNDSATAYRSAALSIAPRWDGLAVVRGANRGTVANLHFFWPRDITAELRGTDTSAIGLDSLTR